MRPSRRVILLTVVAVACGALIVGVALNGIEQPRRNDHSEDFVVAFADLDRFKVLNDEYGHETGDRALRLFGRVLRDSVRPADFPARYGGEEFVVLLPDCTLADARVVANRLIDRLSVAIIGTTLPKFTVSIGLAAWQAPETFEDTVARADAALLAAKSAGRNRVLTTDDLPRLTGTGTGAAPRPVDPDSDTTGAGYTRGAGTNGAPASLGREIGSRDPQ